MTPRRRTILGLLVALSAGVGVVTVGLLERRNQTPPRVEAPTSASIAHTPPSSVHAADPTPRSRPSSSRTTVRDDFVGSTACAACHPSEAAAYAKSHHRRALTLPTAENVSFHTNGTSFSTPLGESAHFTRRGDALDVTTPDGDGRQRIFSVAYAAGVSPLQQYVVATERGKLQTLGVAWDTRPAPAGERLFHVYGPRGIAPSDELYFTQSAQNWNHVCADCHSTFVERRYDVSRDAFDTRWAELAVGCEACHGPGAGHLHAVETGKKSGAGAYAGTFSADLKPAAAWAPSATGSPTPRAQDGVEVEVCAACHSRRQPIHEGFAAGEPFLDAFEPELLRPDRYYADGQVDGEVYEWASFLQSKMYASGVRCSDCHEPHSGELYAAGNALCVRCHAQDRFDVPSHSHHARTGEPGCVDCHLPSKTFMQVDERRDHSIRIPRPDLSVLFGTPNACGKCHSERPAAWAAERLKAWFPAAKPRQHFGEALARDRRGDLDAGPALAALALDEAAPAIARATALERLGASSRRRAVEVLRAALRSQEPLVVYGAVLGAGELSLAERAPLLASALTHRLRAIRIAAGKALAPVPPTEVPSSLRGALERAFVEVETSFDVSASRPATHVERSAFELARGRGDEAEAELRTALRLAPCLAEAHLNLADLARSRGDEARAEQEIRAALRCAPNDGAAHHALGLWLVRAGRKREALTSLRRAVELAPDDARFSYVLAVALGDDGALDQAVEVLGAALARQPSDRELLEALADDERRLGHEQQAAAAAQKLEMLLHD
jgi:predicted CXXCH cytochrome family protein